MTSSNGLEATWRRWWRTLVIGAVLSAGTLSLQGCFDDDDDKDEVVEVQPWSPSELAETTFGPVRGSLTEDEGMLVWKGIPYAAPPIGSLRFTPPVVPEQWSEALTTTEFGQSCLQPASTFGAAESGEDCLYLNVYSPAEAAADSDEGTYPVMVWIHGGAFETGSGNSYLPPRLIERDVVVVTINYRLGIMGFLAHPALTAEAGASGDYGLMDQQAALQWVQDNIKNFGGNAKNVTIFGESAGGHSVLSHIASPKSTGLFHKAIIQSGSYSPGQRTLEAAENQGEAFASAGLNCADVECLRATDAATIQSAQAAADLSFLPNLRDDLLPISIATALETGQYNKVPVIQGTNRDEYRLFVAITELTAFGQGQPSPYDPDTRDVYESALAGLVGPDAASGTADLYPLAEQGDDPDERVEIGLGAVGTDIVFACNGLDQVAAFSNNVNTYAYEFRDRDAPSIIGQDNTAPFDLGAAHAFEIQYVFNSDAGLQARGMDENQIALANAMADYWAQFARTGNPNSESGTGVLWPTYGASQAFLALEPALIGELPGAEFSNEHKCAVW